MSRFKFVCGKPSSRCDCIWRQGLWGGYKCGALSLQDWCACKKRKRHQRFSLTVHTQRTGHTQRGPSDKATIYTQQKNPDQKPTMTAPSSWTSGLQECEKIRLCLSHRSVVWCYGGPSRLRYFRNGVPDWSLSKLIFLLSQVQNWKANKNMIILLLDGILIHSYTVHLASIH